MAKTKTKHHQKRYLQIGFAVVFAASFAVILMERNRVNNELLHQPKPLPLAEHVRGDSVKPYPELKDYRDVVVDALLLINQFMESPEGAAHGSNQALEDAYQALLKTPVPPIYRSLHADVIALAREARKGSAADAETLQKRHAKLYNAYPWLP